VAERSLSRPSTAWALSALVLVATLASLVAAASASAEEPYGARIKSYIGEPSTTQAGGHPDVAFEFEVSARNNPVIPNSCFCNQIKNARVELPAGFIGNPHAVAECTAAQFALDKCPVDSQVGIAKPNVMLNDGGGAFLPYTPLYNLVPQPGQAGLLSFKAQFFNFPTYTVISARTGGDYGLNAEVKGITAYFGLISFRQVMWGVPASPVHDADRFKTGGPFPEPGPISSNIAERPFLSSPTSCVGPLSSTLTTTAYDHGVHSASAPWPETTGCDQLNFNPSLAAKPSTSEADSASGLDVSLKVPQNASPVTPSDSEIRATTVTMPAGFSVNPSAADGKTSCSDAQARFGTTEEAQCPEFAKVGTLSLDSWALPEPIPGGIYLGEPRPGDRYRLIITADGFGTHVKLPGSVHPDPQTGQLTVTFDDLPQAPLTEFAMHFFGSERGLLATPDRCGTYAVDSRFVPWATGLPDQFSTQFFTIDSGPSGKPCPGAQRPFSPGFRAVGASNGAGSHAPFSVYLNRPDGDQNLNTIQIKTPPGFSATLKGVPYCPDSTLSAIESPAYSGLSERAASRCPAASQVGVSSAGAGAGSRPFYAAGKVYLAGPYKGAPLSFAVVTPAVSGPYDLGNVVNRVAVRIDPTNAQVTAVSDPLPQIIGGIPLRLRSVLIHLNRPDFTLNPTNCHPFQVDGLLTGDEGASATPSTHFQMANCDALGFAPRLSTTLTGSTKRTGYPALRAVLTQKPSGEANIARAAVTLPHSVFLAQEHIRTLCTRVQFAADNCPAASIYGKARAISPLLDDPLEGPVYLRSSSNPLPDLVAALKGPASQPLEIDLVGRIDSPKAQIRTTFDAIPDASVSKFVLTMQGGKKGLLVNSADLCKGKNYTTAKITGQNGKKADQRVELVPPCKTTARHKRPDKTGRRVH
jgi:hypothetical protein